MNRRNFFQSIAALTAAIAIPLPAWARGTPGPQTADELRAWFEENFTLAGSIISPGLWGEPLRCLSELDVTPGRRPKPALAAATWKCGVRVDVPTKKWDRDEEKALAEAVAGVEGALCGYAWHAFARLLDEQPQARGTRFWWRVAPEVQSAGAFKYWVRNPKTLDYEWFACDGKRVTVPVVLRFRAAFEGLKLDSMEGMPPLPATL